MDDYVQFLKDRPRHWRDMEAALSACLGIGDLIYTNLDDLDESGPSVMRLLVARPETGKVLLVSASRAPSDEGPVSTTTDEITDGGDRNSREIGRRWGFFERLAVRNALRRLDGRIVHAWAHAWSERRLHLIARVERAGMHDSLRTFTVSRPVGLLKSRAEAVSGFVRPLPKLFVKSGAVRVHGESQPVTSAITPGAVGIL